MGFNKSKKGTVADVVDSSGISNQDSKSYLSKTMKVKGKIISDENITIDGEVNGNVNVSKELVIGKTGFVDGIIDAGEVEIIGRAQGEITVKNKLKICSTGSFLGDLKSEKLVIENGAIFRGKANMDQEQQSDEEDK